MKMRFWIALVALMAGAIACAAPPAVEKHSGEQHVSIIQLIASPASFDGEEVSVAGYLELSDEYEHSLFLDEMSQKSELSANSIAIDLEAIPPALQKRMKDLDRTYVSLAGRFKAGATAFSGGKLETVYRVIPVSGSK